MEELIYMTAVCVRIFQEPVYKADSSDPFPEMFQMSKEHILERTGRCCGMPGLLSVMPARAQDVGPSMQTRQKGTSMPLLDRIKSN
jgi:hypothetical protein